MFGLLDRRNRAPTDAFLSDALLGKGVYLVVEHFHAAVVRQELVSAVVGIGELLGQRGLVVQIALISVAFSVNGLRALTRYNLYSYGGPRLRAVGDKGLEDSIFARLRALIVFEIHHLRKVSSRSRSHLPVRFFAFNIFFVHALV